MKPRLLSFKTKLPVSAAEAFKWHEQKGAFNRLIPPWEKIELLSYSGSIKDGSQAKLRCKLLGPLGFNWLLEHRDYIAHKQFCDTQKQGPFLSYSHSHLFSENGAESQLEDLIEYKLPFSFFSHLLAPLLIEKRLQRTFKYRHRITNQDLAFHSRYSTQPKLNFLIAGATGMIGKQLCSFLSTAGHKVTRVLRTQSRAEEGDIVSGADGKINLEADSYFDCVINLAGAGIAEQRWNEDRKKILIASRVEFTKKLVAALKELKNPPQTFISASGLGFYGDVKDNCPDETSPCGKGFLAELCQLWENAALEIRQTGCRLTNLRLGVVLSPTGGALQKMLLPFTLGLGAKLGSGKQQFGWITLDDVIRAILFIAYEKGLEGPINLVAPTRTTNLEFSRALGKSLNRPVILKIPEFILRLIFGELADEALLPSSNAEPKKIIGAGFKFLYTNPEIALRDLIGL